MDLTCDVPRSPYDKLGGIVFLPRSIDKGRAELAGTLGEYVARHGRSGRLFKFLGISAKDFIEALRDRPTDEDVWAWVAEHMTPRTPEEIAEFNQQMWTAEPEDGTDRWTWAGFRKYLAKCGQAHRTDITRHFDRLDLDEGREVPMGGRQLC